MIASKEWVKSLLSKMNIGKYSTNEIRVGTWIDGKPIYRKVIETTAPNCTTGGTFAHKNVDIGTKIDMLVDIKGSANNGNGWQTIFPIMSTVSTQYFSCGVSNANTGNTTLNMSNSHTSWSNKQVKIVLEYTKTTD